MVKNMKKGSVSEGEVAKKKAGVAGNKVLKQKKPENKISQNGQATKQIKAEVSKDKKVAVKAEKQVKTVPKKAGVKVTKDNKVKSKKKSNTGPRKYYQAANASLTVEQIKEKIEEIHKRGELTRTAKRKLSFLNKLMRVKEGKSADGVQKSPKNEKPIVAAKGKQTQNKVQAKEKNVNAKKDAKQSNKAAVKQEKKKKDVEEEEEEDDEENVSDEEVSEDEDESDMAMEVDEEDSEEEEEEEEEDSEDDESKEVKVKLDVQNQKQKEVVKNGDDAKKKRYVLFVGNLPYNITSEELKKHFLTKVSQIVDVRIPMKDANSTRGFAYVELSNSIDFEKALSLNFSTLGGRRIKVQYSGTNKKEGVAKNFKLNALQRAGKLAGGKPKRFPQKPFTPKAK